MSCITKILEVKGDKPVLLAQGNDIAIEGGGVFKGYEYLITFTERGHRCGYVAIPESHPLYKSEESYPDYEVHGGVTFFSEPRFEDITGFKCTDKWIGFDAMHGGDKECLETILKYFGENDHIKFTKTMNKTLGDMLSWKGEPAMHRTFAYMKNECRLLINQLIKQELSHAA